MQNNTAQKDIGDIKDFLNKVTGSLKQRVEEELGSGYVRLHVTEAEKRQARHDIQWVEDIVVEILRNSRDAGANNIFLGSKKDAAGFRQIIIIDDGKGIPERFYQKIFEPRVTSKLDTLTIDDYGIHGRGMALYSIKCNTAQASVVWSAAGRGTVFYYLVDTNISRERKDQSTFPSIKVQEGRRRVIGGPHNIARCITEFALSYPNIKLFFGNPAEIVSTMYHLALSENDKLSPWSELVHIKNHNKFMEHISDRFNINLSERNSQRILQGEIPPVSPIIIRRKKIKPSLVVSEKKMDTSFKLGFNTFELAEMAKQIESIVKPFSRRYALSTMGKPSVYINNNQLTFKIFFKRDLL